MVQRLDIAYDRIEKLKKKVGNDRTADKFAGVGKKIAQLEGKIAAHVKKIAALERKAKAIEDKYRKVQALLESGD